VKRCSRRERSHEGQVGPSSRLRPLLTASIPWLDRQEAIDPISRGSPEDLQRRRRRAPPKARSAVLLAADGRTDGPKDPSPAGLWGPPRENGPPSPLLSNLMLEVLDRELIRRVRHWPGGQLSDPRSSRGQQTAEGLRVLRRRACRRPIRGHAFAPGRDRRDRDARCPCPADPSRASWPCPLRRSDAGPYGRSWLEPVGMTDKPARPAEISPLSSPPRSPELDPVENTWPFLRQTCLSNRVFETSDDIPDACGAAWNALVKEVRAHP